MPTPKVERLINLTVALLETRRPLTFAEIRAESREYGQRDDESARRMFERDKDDLRRLGVPVESRPLDAFGGEIGYIVDRRRYELPDVDLTADEVAALALALRMSASPTAALGLSKLTARAPDPGDLEAPVTAQVSIRPDAVDAVAEAVVDRAPVRFSYRAGDGAVSQREVDPYAVTHRKGAWYLVGRDHRRDALRAFRLDRVTDTIRTVGDPGAFTTPDDLDVTAAIAGPAGQGIELELAAGPDAAWEIERRGGTSAGTGADGRTHYRAPHGGGWSAASMVLTLGPDVEVVSPADVRADVLAAARATMAANSDADG